MRPRNALLVVVLLFAAGTPVHGRTEASDPQAVGRDDQSRPGVAKGASPAAGRTFLPISDDDASLLRAVLSERFPSWPARVFVFDTTAVLDPATARPDSQRSLRGSDLGRNVTLVTSREALDALSRSQDSAALIDLTLPRHETDLNDAPRN